jgi:hypothetical protein
VVPVEPCRVFDGDCTRTWGAVDMQAGRLVRRSHWRSGASATRAGQANRASPALVVHADTGHRATTAATNLVFVPSLYFGIDASPFYSPLGWGNTALTASLLGYWALAAGVGILRGRALAPRVSGGER